MYNTGTRNHLDAISKGYQEKMDVRFGSDAQGLTSFNPKDQVQEYKQQYGDSKQSSAQEKPEEAVKHWKLAKLVTSSGYFECMLTARVDRCRLLMWWYS
jgi:hypothetical protein